MASALCVIVTCQGGMKTIKFKYCQNALILYIKNSFATGKHRHFKGVNAIVTRSPTLTTGLNHVIRSNLIKKIIKLRELFIIHGRWRLTTWVSKQDNWNYILSCIPVTLHHSISQNKVNTCTILSSDIKYQS